MRVDEKRVVDVLLDNAVFIWINLIDVIRNINSPTSGGRCRFDDPNVLERTFLAESHEMGVEVRILVGQDIGLW